MNNLIPIKFKNKNVITTELLAEVYGTDIKNIQMNFKRNEKNFEEGKHYYFLQGEELKQFKSLSTESGLPVNKFAPNLYLWTERGANRHCKILDTDKAWEQFDNLEETYFRVKENNQPVLPTTYKEALEHLIEQVDQNEVLQFENKLKDKQIETLKPLATYTERILRSTGLFTTSQIAKDYGMGPKDFNKMLNHLRIQYKRNGQWLLYAKYHDKGYTGSETIPIKHSDGRPDSKMNTKWTQEGRLFLYEFLKSRGIVPTMEQGYREEQISLIN